MFVLHVTMSSRAVRSHFHSRAFGHYTQSESVYDKDESLSSIDFVNDERKMLERIGNALSRAATICKAKEPF